MFRCELVDSNAYIICLFPSDLCHKSLYQDEGVEVIAAELKRKRSILIWKLHMEHSSFSYIDTTASLMLSKLLFNTVNLIVRSAHFTDSGY